MGLQPSQLSDDDFLYGYLAEYLDGELPADQRARYEKLAESAGGDKLKDRFLSVRGRLQMALQSYYLKETELMDLHAKVQDPSLRATEEALKIDQLEKRVAMNTIRRRIFLTLIVAAVVGFVVWYFAPRAKVEFDALGYLGYEALAMEAEEQPETRLDLPTNDMDEIRQYLQSYPGLDFKPLVLADLGQEWKPDGATLIDYEIAKVAVVQYGNKGLNEKMFNFSFAGNLSDLPRATPGNYEGKFTYQTYASDELNMVAWQQGGNVVGMLVGHRSAPELASLAHLGISDNK